jgi:hypothetical protein
MMMAMFGGEYDHDGNKWATHSFPDWCFSS